MSIIGFANLPVCKSFKRSFTHINSSKIHLHSSFDIFYEINTCIICCLVSFYFFRFSSLYFFLFLNERILVYIKDLSFLYYCPVPVLSSKIAMDPAPIAGGIVTVVIILAVIVAVSVVLKR